MSTTKLEADVEEFSSAKLGDILRLSGLEQKEERDEAFIDRVKIELMLRGDYESEMTRNKPH